MSAVTVPVEHARPIRREEYEKMVGLGLFEGERVELLYGVIVQMSPKGRRTSRRSSDSPSCS